MSYACHQVLQQVEWAHGGSVVVGIVVGSGRSVRIVGHGITVATDFVLADGISVCSENPKIDSSFGSRTIGELRNTLNVMAMENLANFSLLIEHEDGGQKLAVKAWNALWLFNLLALSCRSPVFPLYSVVEKGSPRFNLANRNIIINELPEIRAASSENLAWAAAHFHRYDGLLKSDRFRSVLRSYSNAHYLFDDEPKVMLLWAGIEGLLDIDGELRRRIALHAAILHDGNIEEKVAYLAKVKKAYDVRSRVVHGSAPDTETLRSAYHLASDILVSLLRKVVALGRIPTAAELDQIAVSASLT
jgi:hypothetical protein